MNTRAALQAEPRYLSVTELATLLNHVLEREVSEVSFEGEISQLTFAASGHLYFTVKDAQSQISAVMWRGAASALSFKPEAGVKVVCSGRPNVYPRSGRLQIVVHRMVEAGAGLLQKKFLELKAKLEAEGLFAPERKRPLPYLPRAIGIVTSATGAVIHDIMVRLRERMPNLPVYLIDVRVQGEGAAEEIAQGIEQFSASGLVDLIITGRGGGSLEDLWAFNEERVVRAIFGSRVPVVSAVGHEVDISLADLAADLRAPTPTAAAEMVVPHRDELLKKVAELERRLSDFQRWLGPLAQSFDELVLRLSLAAQAVLDRTRLRLDAASARIRAIEPGRLLELFASRIDGLQDRLRTAGSEAVRLLGDKLQRVELRLARSGIPERLKMQTQKLDSIEQKLQLAVIRSIERSTRTVAATAQRLEAVSPRNVLRRGYSIVEHKGAVVSSSKLLSAHDRLSITFAEGSATAEVMEKKA